MAEGEGEQPVACDVGRGRIDCPLESQRNNTMTTGARQIYLQIEGNGKATADTSGQIEILTVVPTLRAS